jgi:hypothetical protein
MKVDLLLTGKLPRANKQAHQNQPTIILTMNSAITVIIESAVVLTTHDNALCFKEAFAPLAYHLFPDGCPFVACFFSSSCSVNDVWPQPPNNNQTQKDKQTKRIRRVVQCSIHQEMCQRGIVAIKQLQRLGKILALRARTCHGHGSLCHSCHLGTSSAPTTQQQSQSHRDGPTQSIIAQS